MRINNEDLLEVDGVRATKDMASSFNLKPLYLGHVANYAIQLVFTGSPVGTLKLQVSNDPGKPDAGSEAQKYADVTNWTDLGNSSQAISASGDHVWTVENAGYTWVRAVYTATSGTGTLTHARANTKGI